MKIRLVAALVLCLALASLTAAVTLGHASLVSSDPAQGATIPSPYTVTATFDEELTPNGSSLVIQTASGAQVASGRVSTSDDKTMTADLPHEADGQYTALWTAVTADDNGVTRGTFTFTVGAPTPSSGAPSTAAPAPSATNGSGGGGGNDLLIALVLAVVIIGGVAGFVLYRNRR